MGFASAFYHGVTKRTSTYALAIIISAFVFERSFDAMADCIWESNNKGKLWKDIKHKYIKEE